jgi:D-3-phosphoglycerate dehydrogenase
LAATGVDRPLYELAVRTLEEAGLAVIDTGSMPPDERLLSRLVASADAMLATLAPVGAPVIDAGARLKVIAKVGSGVDNIDVAAATRRGIPVCNTPAANSESVADHVFALILALARQLLRLDGITRAGEGWNPWPPLLGEELTGKVLGIVGFGRIGRAVARRGHAFGMTCLAHDLEPHGLAPEWTANVGLTSLDEVLAGADYISLHVPLSEATRGMIGARELARMKPSSYLINTARGPIVDEQALVRALYKGSIRGAGIDVFADEPPISSPLIEVPNAVVTPHVAGMTSEATARARYQAAESILTALRGRFPPRAVNASDLAGSASS